MADLITIDTYKQAKAISSSKEDERLLFLVPAVSQLVKTYCGNSFVDYNSTPYTEYITVEWETNVIQLTETPLIDIYSIAIRPDYSYTSYEEVPYGDYITNRRTDTVVKREGYWPIGIESVEVIYTAGYVLSGPGSLPEDLKLAVIDLITYYLKDEYKALRMMSGATMQNAPTSTMSDGVGFPDHIKRILDLYRYI